MALVLPFWRFILTKAVQVAVLLIRGKKMDDKDLVGGALGAQGAYDVAFKGGALVAELDYTPVGGVKTKLSVALDAVIVLNALKAAIPGHFDDAIIDAAIGLLTGAPVPPAAA